MPRCAMQELETLKSSEAQAKHERVRQMLRTQQEGLKQLGRQTLEGGRLEPMSAFVERLQAQLAEGSQAAQVRMLSCFW